MAQNKIQKSETPEKSEIPEVKVKMDRLWTFGLCLWILIGLLMLVALALSIFALFTLITTIIPKISSAIGGMGALSGLPTGASGFGASPAGALGSGANPAGSLGNGNYGGAWQGLAIQIHDDADKGNWDAATNEFAVLQAIISQTPSSALPSGMPSMDALRKDIEDKNQTAIDDIFSRLQQTGALN